MIYRFVPKGPRLSEMELIWLVRGDAEEGRDYDLGRLTWLWRVTTEQDKAIIEHTSRGIRSHYYEPGPIAPMEYNELRYIDWYLEEVARAG
jgi:Rieske 2Fe-2S family protein